MSPLAPRLSGRELIKRLSQHGFLVARIRGSYHYLKHSDGRSTVVPVHGNEPIGVGLFSKILRDTELSKVELLP